MRADALTAAAAGDGEDAEAHLSIAHALKTLGHTQQPSVIPRAASCRRTSGTVLSLANLKTTASRRGADAHAQCDRGPGTGLRDVPLICARQALGCGEFPRPSKVPLGNALKRPNALPRRAHRGNTDTRSRSAQRGSLPPTTGYGIRAPDPILIIAAPRRSSRSWPLTRRSRAPGVPTAAARQRGAAFEPRRTTALLAHPGS